MNFSELAFKRLDRDLQIGDYVRWAEGLLAEGCSSTVVAELASYSWDHSPDRDEVERTFQLCIEELGLRVPTEEDWYQVLKDFTCSICQAMLNGTCEAEGGFSELLNISEDHHDPYVLTVWLDLASDLHEWTFGGEHTHIYFNTSLLPESRESCILKTAEQYIALCELGLPEKFPRVWWCTACRHVGDAETATTQQVDRCPSCGEAATLANVRHYEQRNRIARTAPNPSIERTCHGGLCPPRPAAHVKR